jgi:hypothetical protein
MCAKRSSIVRRRPNRQPRAAGVSPPWFAEPSTVPRKSRTVQRPCDTGTRAAFVSPPLVGNDGCNGNTPDFCVSSSHTENIPQGAYAPPLLVQCERLPAKKRFFRCTNAGSLERRASARRGSLNRTLCRGNHTLFGDHATLDQERHASARRGTTRTPGSQP